MTNALAVAAGLEKVLADYKETVTTVKVTDEAGDATEQFQAAVLKALLEAFLAELN